MGILSSLVGGIVAPVAKVFEKREDTKLHKASVAGKIALAKQTGATEITLKAQEWENIAVRGTEDSWKDEYITILVTAPFALIVVGAVAEALFGYSALLDSVVVIIDKLATVGVDLGEIMLPVVLAAIGIRGVKGLLK